MVGDELDHRGDVLRRSSSAWATYANAFRRISFARFSSRTSRSSSFNRSRSLVVRPGRCPASRCACRTHVRRVSAVQPSFGATDCSTAHAEAWASRCSSTIRTARSRTSGDNRLGRPIDPILPSNEVSEKPGTVHRAASPRRLELSAQPDRPDVRHRGAQTTGGCRTTLSGHPAVRRDLWRTPTTLAGMCRSPSSTPRGRSSAPVSVNDAVPAAGGSAPSPSSHLHWLLDAMAVVASETYTATSTPIQFAAVTAFAGDPFMDQYLMQCRQVLRALGRYCANRLRHAGLTVAACEGAFYLFPDFDRSDGPFAPRASARVWRSASGCCRTRAWPPSQGPAADGTLRAHAPDGVRRFRRGPRPGRGSNARSEPGAEGRVSKATLPQGDRAMDRVTTWLRSIQDPAASPNENRHAKSSDQSYLATLAS